MIATYTCSYTNKNRKQKKGEIHYNNNTCKNYGAEAKIIK